ncbi:MAG: hypothetical protein FWB88_00945 [Defluviitaleaceae bacterium]|nr:hypothetical protein [Defluviitaleaceae bacterium]MCL2238363.1 hypothetical protein [Defluviitaleaceae bacterium]
MKAIIFGAGEGGKPLFAEMKRNGEPYEIVGFIDNRLKGTELYDLPVISPEQIQS